MGARAVSRVTRLLAALRRVAPQSAPEVPEGEWDIDFYRDWNQDLRGFDDERLRDHWLRCGRKEGRAANLAAVLREKGLDGCTEAGPWFDWRVYLALYKDLREAHLVSPSQCLAHYLEHGRKEGRNGDFNLAFYTSFYPDLAIFREDREAAIAHWLDFGCAEGRSPSFRHYAALHGVPPELVTEDVESGLLAGQLGGEDGWPRVARAFTQEPPGLVPLWNDERDEAFYVALATGFQRTGKDDKAAHLYAGLADRQPAVAHCALGNIATRVGWRANSPEARHAGQRLAVAHFQAALRHNPDAWEAEAGLAQGLCEAGRYEEALEVAGRALCRHPDKSANEQMLLRAAKGYWTAGWADSNCLALAGERDALFDRAGTLAERMDRAYRLLALRGVDEPVVARLDRKRVLIVADCQLPQCVRYRIEQKAEQLEAAGYQPTIVSWSQTSDAWRALPFHDHIIFYRVPAFPEVIRLVSTARALGKVTFYEIDDLLFDPVYPPPRDSYGGLVEAREYVDLMKGAALYRAAAKLCDYGISSTLPLVEQLAGVVRSGHCFLHRNALDRRSPLGRAKPASGDGRVNIFYGSATRAHNSDFVEQALPALTKVLDERPEVRLTVAGYLNLPSSAAERFGDRLLQLPMQEDLAAYTELLWSADINIAVLQPDVMTDCKSELKWLEAAVMGIPSVVSPTRNYLDVVEDGVDALVAGTPGQWHAALSGLCADAALRHQLGQAARAVVLSRYGVPTMAENLRKILGAAADRIEETQGDRGRDASHA